MFGYGVRRHTDYILGQGYPNTLPGWYVDALPLPQFEKVNGMKALLTSIRFWTAIIGVFAIIAVQHLGWSQEYTDKLTQAILVLVGIVIAGYSYRGAGK